MSAAHVFVTVTAIAAVTVLISSAALFTAGIAAGSVALFITVCTAILLHDPEVRHELDG